MFDKASSYARRGFVNMKHHAKTIYRQGANMLSKIDYGYQVLKKLHNVAAPMLKDAGVHSKTTKAFSDFEHIRSKITSAHESAVKAVSTIRKGVPELGF